MEGCKPQKQHSGGNSLTAITLFAVKAILVYKLSFFVFTSGVGSIPVGLGRLLTATFCSTFAQSLYLIALHFLYRYIQIAEQSIWFKKTSYVSVLVALYFLIALDYGCVCSFNFGPSSVKDVYFEEQMWMSYRLNTGNVGYLGPIYALNGDVQWFGDLFNVSVVIGLTLVVIPFCGIGIFRSLYRHEVTSKKTKQLQEQMSRLLLIQSFFPLSFAFAPSSSCDVTVWERFRCVQQGARGSVVGILLTLYPVLEPLVVLSCVTSYREAIKIHVGRAGTLRKRRGGNYYYYAYNNYEKNYYYAYNNNYKKNYYYAYNNNYKENYYYAYNNNYKKNYYYAYNNFYKKNYYYARSTTTYYSLARYSQLAHNNYKKNYYYACDNYKKNYYYACDNYKKNYYSPEAFLQLAQVVPNSKNYCYAYNNYEKNYYSPEAFFQLATTCFGGLRTKREVQTISKFEC
ncbi:hypothetical protein Q1695_005990 [Nippostrongylus brasiliensis]|nr:hypothetical protein Q1695_005990 [Nippostrongylus brasiliensis]